MDFIALISQIAATIITALVSKFFDKKMNTSFDRKDYCKRYTENQANKQNNRQYNQIKDSFNGSVTGSINVEQKNYNTQIVNTVYAKGNNTSSSDGIASIIGMGLFVLAVCVFALFAILYLKYKFYFDYWYPFVLMIMASAGIFFFYKNFKSANDLYWYKCSYFGIIILLFIFLYLFTSPFDYDAKALQLLNNIKVNISSSTDFAASLNIFKESINSEDVQHYIFLFIRQASVFIPFIILSLDIYFQVKYKKPLMTSMFFILAIFLLVEFVPPFILSLG